MTATVAWISISPIKGMRMQGLEQVELTGEGAVGDRQFFLVDEAKRLISVTRLGPLVEIVPELDPGAGTLTLNFPGGEVLREPVELGEVETVTFFGESVRARPETGGFSEAISAHCGVRLRLMARPERRPAVDRGSYGAATLLGRGSLERLSREAAESGQGGPIDERRFRMTFGIDGIAPHEEDEWIDGVVTLGGASVKVREKVGRCAATTRDPEGGEVDLKTLHYIGSYRSDVVSAEPLPFGVYASVEKTGVVRVGDPVTSEVSR